MSDLRDQQATRALASILHVSHTDELTSEQRDALRENVSVLNGYVKELRSMRPDVSRADLEAAADEIEVDAASSHGPEHERLTALAARLRAAAAGRQG